jgi:hypothetical protein
LVLGGGLWVVLSLMLWLSNPEGDVDRGPSGQVFAASLILWLAVGAAGVAWAGRRRA